MEVGRGDEEGLKRSVELDNTCWGDPGWQDVRLGDGEVLKSSVELGGAGRSPKVNDEAGRAESVSITCNVGGEEGNRKTFSTNLT